MEVKRLETGTLSDALRRMEVGEVRRAPLGYKVTTVQKACSEFNKKGERRYYTSTKTGDMFITRAK